MPNGDVLRNAILARLPAHEWEVLRAHVERLHLPAGHTFARPERPPSHIYFPESGVISVVAAMETGGQVQVAAIGPNGLLGASVILNMPHVPFWMLVDVESTGYAIRPAPFMECFQRLEALRHLCLEYLGKVLHEVARSAACNRFHTSRQRLARWLLALAELSGRTSLDLTHEYIAQMVGGPRHAVTAALNELRDLGGIHYVRGRVDVVDAARLAASACECHQHQLG